MKDTTLLAKLLGLLTTNITEVKPTRKTETDKESVLGTLPDKMQKLWAVRKSLLDVYQKVASKIGDLVACYKADVLELGETGPAIQTKRTEAVKAIQTLLDEAKIADREFHLVDHLFHGLLYADYHPLCPEGMEVIAVRENFEVIAREDDTREDWKTPWEEIAEELVESGLLQTATLNIFICGGKPQGGDDDKDTESVTPPAVVPDNTEEPVPTGT